MTVAPHAMMSEPAADRRSAEQPEAAPWQSDSSSSELLAESGLALMLTLALPEALTSTAREVRSDSNFW